jgi:hypothetical protein
VGTRGPENILLGLPIDSCILEDLGAGMSVVYGVILSSCNVLELGKNRAKGEMNWNLEKLV